jgi:SAM-dependent methyltransferase
LAEGESLDDVYTHDAILSAQAHHFWFNNRRRLVVWALARYFPSAARMLEIGCGTGFVLAGVREAFPKLGLVASDSHVTSLRHAATRLPELDLLQLDARRIPFRDEFDVLGAFDVIEHIDEDEDVLQEMRRALRPRGGLLLTIPQHPFLWSAFDDWSQHRRRYTQGELRAKLDRAGFDVLRFTSFSSLLLPLLVLSRRRPGPDLLDELRIGPIVNGLLAAPTALERALIRAGVSFPAGGSLLAVARAR